ncbi:hypothetical protein [Salinimicrobium sp. GXAS 041]|uniref:hypothetical protein n=1 Tax=Salinimicrobium sp. GXAS 041 TaxID=3400806 RepID=UPI003C763173
MALRDILGTVNCGASGVIGSGLRGCPIDLENITNFGFLKPGTILTDFSRETLRTLQKEGKYIPLLNGFDTTWNNEENQMETAENSGKMSKSRDGLYSFTATFTNGLFFQKVLKSMDGQNRWDVLLIDDAGTVAGTSRDKDEFRGFRVQMFSTNPYTPKAGATSAKTSVTIQLANSNEVNMYADWITADNYDFDITTVDGVNQVNLLPVSGFVAASTSLVVKPVLDMDNHTLASGLAVENFLVKVNGNPVTPASVTENASVGTYTIELASALSAEDKVEVVLYNSSANQRVIEVGTSPEEILYQSKELVEVAAAA